MVENVNCKIGWVTSLPILGRALKLVLRAIMNVLDQNGLTLEAIEIKNVECLLLCRLCKWLTKKVLFPFNDSLFMFRVELPLFLHVNYWKVLFKAEGLILLNKAMVFFVCCYFQIIAHETLTEWPRLEFGEFCCVLKQLLCFMPGKEMPIWM